MAKKHFTEYIDEIMSKMKSEDYDGAKKLLLKCIELTEEESNKNSCGVAPGYYEKLAIIYRKEKKLDEEILILERYDNQVKSPGVNPKKLKERLLKLKAKRDKQK